MLRTFCSGLMFILLAAMPVRAETLTSIPADSVEDPKAFWRATMEEFYGRYEKRRKCWIGRRSGETLCMRPHLLSVVREKDEDTIYVAMSGYAVTAEGGHADCHACAGILGLVKLRAGGNRLALVARNDLSTNAGAWGRTPPEEAFRLARTITAG